MVTYLLTRTMAKTSPTDESLRPETPQFLNFALYSGCTLTYFSQKQSANAYLWVKFGENCYWTVSCRA